MDIDRMTTAEEDSRLDAIFENVTEGIIIIDQSGIMERVNPAAAKIFGYSKEELIGQNVSILMPEPHRSEHDGYINNYLTTREPKIIGKGREVQGLKKDGTIFPFHLSVSEVKLKDRSIFTGIILDLTEKKENERIFSQYTLELERRNRELQNFAYVSSHDLQEPLRKIRAFGDRVYQKEFTNLSDKGKDYIDRMLNAAERMQDLINGLLTFSRLETKAQPFSQVDLSKVLNEVLEDLEISIQKTGAKVASSKLPEIEAEWIQMRQLFQNLISNSIKFRKENETPVIKIDHSLYKQNKPVENIVEADQIEIRFTDNGIGFDEKYLSKIFTIFQKLNGSKQEGSGIGLAICQKIVHRHGGTISAQSTPNQGTTFFVNLPVK